MSAIPRLSQLAARQLVRSGWRSAAGNAARERLARVAASQGGRRYVKAVERVAKVGLATSAFGALATAYYQRNKRPTDGGGERPAKRERRGRRMNNQSHGIIVTRRRLGRKEPYDAKMRKIQKASERAIVYAFRGINPLTNATGSNKGWFDLNQGSYTGSGIPAGQTCFPVHCYNLTAIDQQGTINANLSIAPVVAGQIRLNVNVPWKLGSDSAGNMSWLYGRAGETNDVAEVREWSVEKITNQDTPTVLPTPGVKAYLDWVSARFMVYGKKKDETRLYIRLVKFTRPEYCPEFGYLDSPLTVGSDAKQRFDAVAQNFVKGLINNPIATKSNIIKEKFFTVLFEKYISIPPKMTDDENDDPMKVQFDLFKRMNKLIDYSDPQRNANGAPQETLALLNVEQYIAPSNLGYRSQPKRLEDNVYLMVSCWDPRIEAVPTTDYQNSYDLNLRKKHTIELV